MATTRELYRSHLDTLDRFLADAIERAGRSGIDLDTVVFHAGRARTYHADDYEIAFWATPHFRRWVPLASPEHCVVARPGKRPKVIRVLPHDYWVDTSPPPASYWENEVDLHDVNAFEEVADAAGDLGRAAYIGDSPEAAATLGIPVERIEPPALMHPLDWHRATKTEHEIALLRIAADSAAAGHLAAREVFLAGGSERELYWTFLEGSDQVERHVPFETITALDSKASTLHYQHKRGPESAPGKVFLLDAGGSHSGYASDMTRTWLAEEGVAPEFRRLVEGVDELERRLVAMIEPGLPYLKVHLAALAGVAELLAEVGVFKVSAEEAQQRGLQNTFMPHGVGHHLGIQVHDVGGHQAGPDGGQAPPPAEYPYLRNTRTLEPGHIVTVEPGIYFIPLLLEPLRQGENAGAIDWQLVDRLIPHGGIRIEDDVLCTEDGHEDYTRPLLFGPRGE